MWSFFSRDPAKGFPYEVLDQVDGLDSDQSIWKLHHGKQKSNGNPVSVFVFDVTSNSETAKQTAQASAKRLKTLRHPNVLSFMDSLETDKCIYVVTEPVVPLSTHLHHCDRDTSELAISWGLHQIVKGLGFLINSANIIHNNVCMSSMFVDASAGEWKLGGVDYMYPASGEGSNLPPIKSPPGLEKYDPPEKHSSSGKRQKSNSWSADMWGLGCLIWEVFNGTLPRSSSLKVIGKIPKNLVRSYCELVSANPALRPSPDRFLENCKLPDNFMGNHFVQTNLFLEEIQIKEGHELSLFFNDLPKHLDDFPKIYSKHKILPQLLNAFQYGNGGPAVLPPLFKLGKLLDTTEYQAQIVPCVVKLFSSTDRSTRIHLLRQLPLFVEHLQPAVVNSQVFPNMVTGFMDTNPAIREQSVKGMLLMAPKLNDNNLNNELMKHFARLQAKDEQGPIRTNTTVCLGKLTGHLNPATRQKVISSAFIRAMRDPFPAARISGILAMCNNVQYFTVKDCATKALPALCSSTVDSDKQVRENAFKTIKVFLDKLKRASDDQEEAMKMDQAAGAVSSTAAIQTSGWTGWMTTGVSSITSKLYTNKPQGTAETSEAQSPSSAPAKKEEKTVEQKTSSSPSSPQVNDEDDVGDNDAGWNDDEDWEGLEELEYNSSHTAKPVTSYKGRLITSRQLKAMEENIWEDLHAEKAGGGSGSDPDEAGGDGWANSWENDSPKPEVQSKKATKNDAWGGGWDEDTWADEDQNDVTPSRDHTDLFAATNTNDDVSGTSTYDWEQSGRNESAGNFFDEFSSKPKKTLAQRNHPSKTAAVHSGAAKPKASKATAPDVANPGWDDDGWGNDDWGGNSENKGLSKAERLKAEREEKRRLRQKQMEERKAAKSGPKKLGARKCD